MTGEHRFFIDLPWQLPYVLGPGLFVIALAGWDLASLRRLHTVTLYGGPAVLLWQVLPNAYMNSEWWMRMAAWFVRVFG